MKKMLVPRWGNPSPKGSIADLALRMDELEAQPLNFAPWKEYPYQPRVFVAIAHNDGDLYLKYTVEEENIAAATGTINGPVWEDSCVEFFISFGDDSHYYNLEFNCLGIGLVGWGSGKTDRSLLPAVLISQIRSQAVITNLTNGLFSWQLTLIIPASVFMHHQFVKFDGVNARANFYKCGDKLPAPHFICWNNIDWPEPNFHLPDFFSEIAFE